jgi:hypothetical protein
MSEERLPVGSIVTIRFEEGMYMIVGFESESNGEKSDYCVVDYPFGFVSSDQVKFIDKDYIKEVKFMGYKDEDFNNMNTFFNNN